jgi:hypothetical protein
MGFFQAEVSLARFRGCIDLRATCNVTNPKRAHEFEARQSAQIVPTPFIELGSFDPTPAIGLRTTASLKWSITAAMANAPPRRSYKLAFGQPT